MWYLISHLIFNGNLYTHCSTHASGKKIFRKDMDVNLHDILFNFALRDKLKQRNMPFHCCSTSQVR